MDTKLKIKPKRNTPSIKEQTIKHLYEQEDKLPSRTVVYVPNRREFFGRFPNVTVYKRPRDGRYVVIEQRPVFTQFSDHIHKELERLRESEKASNVYDPEVKFRSVKPPWKWAAQGNYMERSFDREYFTPYLPPIKPVWQVESKVGSLNNISHQPKGGDLKIPRFKVKWDAKAKVGSLDNIDYDKYYTSRSNPDSTADGENGESGGGKLKLPKMKPRYGGSGFLGPFGSIHFVPGGTVHMFKKKNNAKARVGSLDNVKFESFGGYKTVPKYEAPRWKSEAKVRSLEKIFHEPKGGDVTIVDLKPKWKSKAKVGSLDNVEHTPFNRRFKVPHFEDNWEERIASKVGSLDNIDHSPKGGNKPIFNEHLKWNRKSKIADLWKHKHHYVDPNDLEYDEDKEIEERIKAMLNYKEQD